MNNKVAIGVGYYFGIVPAEAITGIETKSDGRSVRFEGENYDLFKASTYEGSRKFDKLLDAWGEYPINSFKIEPVIMSGTLELTIPGFNEERDSLHFGGYCFERDDNHISFDFGGSVWNIEQDGDKVTVTFETGRTPFGIDYFLDEAYEEEYEEMGLRINDITAEFLAGANRIIEFTIDAEIDGKEYATDEIAETGGIEIKSLFFENGNEEFAMNQSALDAFNEQHAAQHHERKKTPELESQISEAKATSEAVKERDGGDNQRVKDSRSL